MERIERRPKSLAGVWRVDGGELIPLPHSPAFSRQSEGATTLAGARRRYVLPSARCVSVRVRLRACPPLFCLRWRIKAV